MADVLTKEQRHRNMQHIRGKDTKAEVVLRKTLWARGYRYRKNYSMLPGKPDIVITKERICIFVDSEFFHGKDYLKGYKSNKYNSLKEQLFDAYVAKSESGEQSIQLTEKEIAQFEFSNASTNL